MQPQRRGLRPKQEVTVLEARALEAVQDSSRGVVDTAAARSVAGGVWTDDYLKKLDVLGLGHLVTRTSCNELFRFGDGVAVKCSEIICAPAVIANQPMMVSWRHLPGLKLSLLLGRDFLIEHGWGRRRQADEVGN